MSEILTALVKYQRTEQVEAVQLSAVFDAPHPSPLHLAGVTYDPRNRWALVPDGEFGSLRAVVGDWIVRESDGRMWPCSNETFVRDYTAALAAPQDVGTGVTDAAAWHWRPLPACWPRPSCRSRR